MKTAEEWVSKFGAHGVVYQGDTETTIFDVREIRQIQLDAMKEGMRRAARIADWMGKEILSDAEQLTEKDLT